MVAGKKRNTSSLRTIHAGVGLLAGALLTLPLSGAAVAQDGASDPVPPALLDPLPNWTISANATLASDFVARGLTFTSEGPTVQGGFDITNGLFYAGIYGTALNYGATDKNNDGLADSDGANIEIDYYAGLKKNIKGIDFDLGYFFYSYPNAIDFGGDVDMWEIRGIVSTQTASGFKPSFTAFYTPEYSFKTGRNFIFEGMIEQKLPPVGPFSPKVSALIAYNENETGIVRPDFWYWNAGLTLGFADRFAFDVRYWDTDISGCSTRTVFQCDERVIAKLTALIGEPGDAGEADAAAWPLDDLTLSANVALTTDYVFRGQSQTDEHPAIQGGFELDYRGLYAGAWASNLDFGGADANGDGIADSAVAAVEFDWYGGVRTQVRGVEIDLGVLYYNFPHAYLGNPAVELDSWELKAAASAPLAAGFEGGMTVYYAWNYSGELGENWVFEGTLERALPDIGPFSPKLGGLIAYNDGERSDGGLEYWYWNAGLELGFLERFAFDVRYWDTDLGGCGSATLFQCDERVVATLSAEF